MSHPHGVMIRASRAYLRFSLSDRPEPRLRSQSVPSTATQMHPQSMASLNHFDRIRYRTSCTRTRSRASVSTWARKFRHVCEQAVWRSGSSSP